jgi:hypothetical protein
MSSPIHHLISRRGYRVAAMAALSIIAFARLEGSARAAQVAQTTLIAGVHSLRHSPPFIYRGHPYCWYGAAWRGPGWYRCGYAWHRGLGWGGDSGWHSWYGGHPGHYHPGHHHPGYQQPGHHWPGPPRPAPRPPGLNGTGGNQPS